LPLESAFSWGLNRAIFYAAAKRGFKGTGHTGGGQQRSARSDEPSKTPAVYHLGDEMAFKDEKGGKLNFTIDGKVQTKEDFERQIGARFQGSFKEAWEEALDYVEHFESQTLLSGSRFFSDVYRPKRDEFAQKWTEMSKGETKRASKVLRAKIK
jgi:hypothetical protein